LSLLSYTGYTLEEVRSSSIPQHQQLLDQLDILIDGPYVEADSADLLWRGSANQRIHLLTERHRLLRNGLAARGAGIEVHLRRDGTVFWAGVPPPGFAAELASALDANGISLVNIDGAWT